MKNGAIFDMDGLMFDTEAIWQEGWRILARKYGYEPSAAFGRDISGTSGDVMRGVVRKYYDGIDVDGFIAEERAFVDERLEAGVPLKKGLFEILDFLKGNGVHMAVASSSRRPLLERNLKKAGCEGYFEAIVSGSEVERAKPEPDIFLEAAKRLGLKPEDCYVFEDSFGGVMAGCAAGCTTIMIPDQLQPTDEIRAKADAVYDDLLQALGSLKETLTE